jgi:hypothetical protein
VRSKLIEEEENLNQQEVHFEESHPKMKLRKMSDSNEFFVFENQFHREFQVYSLKNLKQEGGYISTSQRKRYSKQENENEASKIANMIKLISDRFKEEYLSDKRKFNKHEFKERFSFDY